MSIYTTTNVVSTGYSRWLDSLRYYNTETLESFRPEPTYIIPDNQIGWRAVNDVVSPQNTTITWNRTLSDEETELMTELFHRAGHQIIYRDEFFKPHDTDSEFCIEQDDAEELANNDESLQNFLDSFGVEGDE